MNEASGFAGTASASVGAIDAAASASVGAIDAAEARLAAMRSYLDQLKVCEPDSPAARLLGEAFDRELAALTGGGAASMNPQADPELAAAEVIGAGAAATFARLIRSLPLSAGQAGGATRAAANTPDDATQTYFARLLVEAGISPSPALLAALLQCDAAGGDVKAAVGALAELAAIEGERLVSDTTGAARKSQADDTHAAAAGDEHATPSDAPALESD